MNQKIFRVILAIFYNINQVIAFIEQLPALSQDTLQSQYGIIQYAALTFRHGDRTPAALYPTDPYQNYAFPVDLGQLTNQGKRRSFILGKYFEPRYNCLTGEAYLPTRVIMHSSDLDRCLMSGELFYAGYFPPRGAEIWDDQHLWQPIPVHSTQLEYDNVIEMAVPCPVRDLAIQNFYATNPVILSICSNFADMLVYIQNYTGLNMSNCNSHTTIANLVLLQDTLLIESQLQLTLPDWANAIFPEPLSYLRGVLLGIENQDPIVARFNVGPLFSVLTSDMLNIAGVNNTVPQNFYASSPADTPPLHLFSGHDMNIIALLRALNMYQNVTPPYGSALGFELRSRDNSYFVTVVYEYTLNEPLQILEIPGCSGGCTLANFLSLVAPLIPLNYNTECQGGTTTTVTPPLTIIPTFSPTIPVTGVTLPTGWTRPPIVPAPGIIVVSNPIWEIPFIDPKKFNKTRLERIKGLNTSVPINDFNSTAPTKKVNFSTRIKNSNSSYVKNSDSFSQAKNSNPRFNVNNSHFPSELKI